MRTSDGIKVTKAIVHLVDPKKDKLTLSAGEMPLAGSKTIREYLANHIRNSLHDQAARSACFVRGDTPAVLLPTCTQLIDGKIGFVKASHEIAKHLKKSSDKRISAGAVVVCFYTADTHPSVTRFLAIIKLDPSDGFQPVEITDSKGKVFIRLETVENVVPSTRERLLKCAFIRKRDVPDGDDGYGDYDMMLLDRQKAGSQEPAQFFTKDFLGAKLFGDAAELTRTFYTESLGALSEVRGEIGEKKAEIVRRAIDAAVSGTSINVEEWTNNLNIKKSAKEEMLTRIQKGIPDQAFEIDERVAKRLTKKRVFRGDHGFKLQFDASKYDQFVVQRSQHDGVEELLLRMPNLREVEK